MATLRYIEVQVLERVLGMATGYVLRDFGNTKFSRFFKDYGVDIDDDVPYKDAGSKANRLRAFLANAPAALVADVLEGLLELRRGQGAIDPSDEAQYLATVTRLRASLIVTAPAGSSAEDQLMRRAFDSAKFGQLPIDAPVARILVERMEEAQRAIAVGAYLSAIFMCGSVLEAICLGVGRVRMKDVNLAYAKRYSPPQVPPFREWKLAQWIEVLEDLGILSPTIAKFGHGLREFRNFIHPEEQLRAAFVADAHAVRISFHVVVAAADDVVRATTVP